MKKIILITIISIFLASCKDSSEDIVENDNISGGNIYVAGFISDGAGNTNAWHLPEHLQFQK